MLQKADSLLAAVREAARRPPQRLRLADLLQLDQLLALALRVASAFLVAFFLLWVLRLIIRRIERSVGEPTPGALTAHEQRTRTLVSLLRSVGRVVVAVVFVFMLLSAVGVNLGPLLAGAGVVGLAISFGAQSLVKDVISGLFILIENQFGVGDVIRIEGVSGAVERMTLRVVILRDTYGVVHIVPNGEIKKVSNLTRTWARVVLDVSVAYSQDTDQVTAAMKAVGDELWNDGDWRPLLIDPAQVPGIESIADGTVNIRMMVKTLPLKQWDVARELRRRLKLRFDAEGIETPSGKQTLVLHHPDDLNLSAAAPAAASAPATADVAAPSLSSPEPAADTRTDDADDA
jgi:small conductance mechanosensitive channel